MLHDNVSLVLSMQQIELMPCRDGGTSHQPNTAFKPKHTQQLFHAVTAVEGERMSPCRVGFEIVLFRQWHHPWTFDREQRSEQGWAPRIKLNAGPVLMKVLITQDEGP
jgi:hypothetical protein